MIPLCPDLLSGLMACMFGVLEKNIQWVHGIARPIWRYNKMIVRFHDDL